jgi:hypothetical protein
LKTEATRSQEKMQEIRLSWLGFAQRRQCMQTLRKPPLVSFCAEQIRSAIPAAFLICYAQRSSQVVSATGNKSIVGCLVWSSLMCIYGRKRRQTFVEGVVKRNRRISSLMHKRLTQIRDMPGRADAEQSCCFSVEEEKLQH